MNETIELENVVASNGKIVKPIHLNGFVMAINLICCVFGLPLNGFIAFLIIYMRRLRSKTRNIFLLGLVLSNLSAFIPVLFEFAYFHFPSESLCEYYVAIVGLPFVLFLTNMLLSLADRYTALVYPIWHIKKVSVKFVVRCQISASLLVCVIYKFGYVAQFFPLKCEVHILQVRIISVTLFVLFFSCVVAQFAVYRQTKKILLEYRTPKRLEKPNATITPDAAQPSEPIDTARIVQKHFRSISAVNEVGRSSNAMTEHAISQMEMEATQTLIFSVTSLTIMTGPFILFTFTMFICRLHYEQDVCGSISWLAPYFKELVVLHATYHSMIHMCRNSELLTVIKQRLNV